MFFIIYDYKTSLPVSTRLDFIFRQIEQFKTKVQDRLSKHQLDFFLEKALYCISTPMM